LDQQNTLVNISLLRIEIDSMKEYILNVKALEICLAIHDEQYEKVLQFADELKKEEALSSKIRKRLCFAEIAACKVLKFLI